MVRIPALEPPFTPDVEAPLGTMTPAGMPPIGLFRTEATHVRVADALHDSADADDGRWRSAREPLDERQLLDVAMPCGWYHAIRFAARAARVDLEPGAPRFADVTAG